ncbi:hypothetical protein HBB16_13340 [Pseudonocardia sp. MCCB 268]|nr:hypothetical protein [Pseudonocardia cytotoxica]
MLYLDRVRVSAAVEDRHAGLSASSVSRSRSAATPRPGHPEPLGDVVRTVVVSAARRGAVSSLTASASSSNSAMTAS